MKLALLRGLFSFNQPFLLGQILVFLFERHLNLTIKILNQNAVIYYQLAMKMEPEVKLEELPKRVKGSYLKNRTKDLKILSNYYPVLIKPFECLYIFKVVFEPKIANDNRVLREQLLKKALPSIKTQINNPVMGGMNIYSVAKPQAEQATHSAEEYKILIKQVKCIKVLENSKMLLHFLNNGIRNIMSYLDYMEIGQTGKYFSKNGRKQIENQLLIYPGYKVNFIMAEAGMFLRIDPTNKIVQKTTVLDQINSIYKTNCNLDRDEKRNAVKQRLINKIAMTNYGKTKYVRIEDIQFKNLQQVFIPGAQNLTILQYYSKKYHIEARKNQPLLKIQNKNKKDSNPIYILPELCFVTGLPQNYDEFKRKRLSETTIVSPQEKFKNIKKFITQIKTTKEQNCLQDLGIKISRQPQQVNGKILRSPVLHLGKGNKVQLGKQAGFNLFGQPIFDSKYKIRLAIIYQQHLSPCVAQILDTFQETSKRLCLDYSVMKIKLNSRNSNNKNLKEQYISASKEAIQKDCNCVLFFIKKQMKTYYKQLKSQTLLNRNIVTQVVLDSSLKKKNVKSIHTKILLQIAAKCGNILWCPQSPIQIAGKSMLISIDSSKTGGRRKIVGVGTVNDQLTKYVTYSLDLDQSADKFQKMVKIVINLVKKYVQRNKKIPKQLIILTNSCPKNQVKMYYDYFIPHFNKQLAGIGQSAASLKLTIVQTKDLSSQRFFQVYENNGGINNPAAGLLVANTIVSENYDFYLVSQKPRNGCTVPIHFNVINTNSQVQEGVLQQLMYSQCFNYANWTGSIKIPAIMQYAKKLARFCSENLEKNIENQSLLNRLYFI